MSDEETRIEVKKTYVVYSGTQAIAIVYETEEGELGFPILGHFKDFPWKEA